MGEVLLLSARAFVYPCTCVCVCCPGLLSTQAHAAVYMWRPSVKNHRISRFPGTLEIFPSHPITAYSA